MEKIFVLDTNVLIQSPNALVSFEEHTVILPIVCLEELDLLKNDDGEKGANARQVIRFLESLRLKGNLLEGVSLDNGGIIKIEANCIDVSLPANFIDKKNDNRILKICKSLSEKNKNVILVTKDIIVRLKAQMLNIDAQDFIKEQAPDFLQQYTGRDEVFTHDIKMTDFKKKGLNLTDIYQFKNDEKITPHLETNQFLIIHSEINNKKTLLGRFDGKKIVPLNFSKYEPFGISPKNVGQKFLGEALLLSPEIAPLVIVKGAAGTAKTFYSLAVGLERVFESESKEYRKILVTRPNVQFDADIGFLPGTEMEKISPFLRPIIDNLEIIIDNNEKEKYKNEKELSSKIDSLFNMGIISTEAMNFIRGRTITNTYLIIDEAQNLTPKQAKGLITRVGEGTKVILLGDPKQIDHPLLDERTNGLSYASEKMKGSPLCFQITMNNDECERSALAFDAANRM